ncbi:MAG TPA: NmrA/HSCARG family protein [Daejeonella sp.]|nr:NmrA/HSCARG family protein [Daejeonella sp.]
MANKKIIAVTGATGAQGGGLARAILNDKNSEFTVRAITRNPESEKAQALKKAGAELVQADIDQPESLQKALEGAYGAYFVTFFWEHLSPEKEINEAKIMAQAAKNAGLKHVIWSTLEDTRQWVPLNDNRMPTLMEKYKVPHLDAKGESNHFFTDLNVPTTFLYTSFYWENFIYFGMDPQKESDGTFSITLPMGNKKLAGISSEDIGKCAYEIFKKGPEMIGKSVGIAGGHLTGTQMADAFTKVLGKKVVYHEIKPDVYRSLNFPSAPELGNMFQFFSDFDDQVCARRDLEFTKFLNPELVDFNTWINQHKASFPV